MMHIAVSGTHNMGKSSLVEALGACLPHCAMVAEPYERGYVFRHPPSVEDYVVQLRQSLASLRRRSPNVIFDRQPLDFLGYIEASVGAERFELEAWREPIARAVQRLDLVILLRAERRHDPVSGHEDGAFRFAVDDALQEIVGGDCYDLCEGVEVLVWEGAWHSRVETVLNHINGQGAASETRRC